MPGTSEKRGKDTEEESTGIFSAANEPQTRVETSTTAAAPPSTMPGASPPPVTADATVPTQQATTVPPPRDFDAEPRLDYEAAEAFVFETINSFAVAGATARRGALVAERLARTFFVTKVPVPPPTRGYATGDEEEVEEEEEDSKPAAVAEQQGEDTGQPQAKRTRTSSFEGWGDTFKNQTEEWKCETCMSWNPEAEQICKSCEVPRHPGGASEEDATVTAAVASGSIGAGGFTFGSIGPSSSGGFSLGGALPAATAPPGGVGSTLGFSAPGKSILCCIGFV